MANSLSFKYCKSKRIDLSIFDLSLMKSMEYLFCGNQDVEEIYFGNVNTPSLTSMSNVFLTSYNIKKIDFGTLDSSNVKDMSYLFYNLKSITEIDVSKLDTSKVKNFSHMFYKLDSLKKLDISNFKLNNRRKDININYIFESTPLEEIKVNLEFYDFYMAYKDNVVDSVLQDSMKEYAKKMIIV